MDPAGLVPPTADAVVADAVVQDVIQQTHVSLTGEPGVTPSSSLPSELFTSVSVPVDARVPLKLKSKIWNHEYIDFGHLLVNPTLEGKFQLTLQNSDGTSSPSLSFESVKKPKKIYSIDTWLPAFHVFVGVYTSRYTTEAPSLMKYGEIVQDLAVRGHNWRFYDENFRFLRQTQSSTLPWGAVHFELWLRSQQGSSKRNSGSLVPNNAKLGRLLNVPNGYCYKFHKGVDLNVKGLTRPFAVLFVAPTGTPTNFPGLPSPLLPTPVNSNHLSYLLSGYTDSIVYFLISGFTEGFPLHYEGS